MRGAREQLYEQSSSGSQRASRHSDEVYPVESWSELQHSAGNRALLHLLSAGAVQTKPKLSSGLLLQRKCAACAVGAPCSECADEDREEKVQRKTTGLMVQRATREGAESSPAGAQTESPAEPTKAAPSFIVEDDAKDLRSGQMRKSEFLSQLRTAVCSTAEQALAGTMWSAMGCPYIERWLSHYSNQSSAYLERALRKYAPETASARSAHDYIPLVQQRLRRGIEQWRTTGEVPEVPKELGDVEMPGATVGGVVGGLLSGVGRAISGFVGGLFSAVGNAVSGLASGAGQALSGAAQVMFKHHEGQESEAADPVAVRAQLGNGGALDGRVRSRMQSAFGTDFSSVRVHTDARAQELNESLSARAFTIGTDIAFGAGEYRPGTLVGDALIAHELAHVVQQGAASGSSGLMQMGEAEPSSLEEDADVSAVGAMVSLWGGGGGNLKARGRSVLPSLRAGLKLQRCNSNQDPSKGQNVPATPAPTKPDQPPAKPDQPPAKPDQPPAKADQPPAKKDQPTAKPDQPPPDLGERTEELGRTTCNPEQGKMVWSLATEKIPPCMLDCAEKHELAHVKFGQDECVKVSAALKAVKDIGAEAATAKADLQKNPSDANVRKAQDVLKRFEEAKKKLLKAIEAYKKWDKRTCPENEGHAYKVTVDACKGEKTQKQCADSGYGERYKKLMRDWEDFKKKPPCE